MDSHKDTNPYALCPYFRQMPHRPEQMPFYQNFQEYRSLQLKRSTYYRMQLHPKRPDNLFLFQRQDHRIVPPGKAPSSYPSRHCFGHASSRHKLARTENLPLTGKGFNLSTENVYLYHSDRHQRGKRGNTIYLFPEMYNGLPIAC